MLRPRDGDWRFDHCSPAHYQVTRGRIISWHEDGAPVFRFETAEQAATFQSWADTCGIDWTVEPRAQPLPHSPKPPASLANAAVVTSWRWAVATCVALFLVLDLLGQQFQRRDVD